MVSQKKLFALSLFFATAFAHAEENIVIDAASVWRKFDNGNLGIVMNALADHPAARPKEARPLVNALSDLGGRLLGFPGEGSQIYGWASPPFSEPAPKLLRYGKGTVAEGNDEWPSNNEAIVNKKHAFVMALNLNDYIDICSKNQCRALVTLPYESYLTALETTAPKGGKGAKKKVSKTKICLPPDCFIPSKSELVENSKKLASYLKEHNVDVAAFVLGSGFYEVSLERLPSAKQMAIDFTAYAQALADVSPKYRLVLSAPPNAGSKWWREFSRSLRTLKSESLFGFVAVNETPFGPRGKVWDFETYQTKNLELVPETAMVLANLKAANVKARIVVTDVSNRDSKYTPHKISKSMSGALLYFDALGQLLRRREVDLAFLGQTRFAPRKLSVDEGLLLQNNELSLLGQAAKIWTNYGLEGFVAAGNFPVLENPKIRVFVTANASRSKVNVFLLNKSNSPEQASLNLRNTPAKMNAHVSAWRSTQSDVTGKALDTAPSWTAPVDSTMEAGQLRLALEPVSLTMIELSELNK